MKGLLAASLVLVASTAFAEGQVFTQEDLERYQRGASSSGSSSRARSSDDAEPSHSQDSTWEKKRSEEERRKLLSDCIQQQDSEHKLEWDRICRSDNQNPGCLLASYKRWELNDRRDDGKRDCHRQYGY